MLLQEKKESVLRKLLNHVKSSNLGSWQTSRQISLDFMILMAGQWCADSQPLRGWSTHEMLRWVGKHMPCHCVPSAPHYHPSVLVIEIWTVHDRSSQMKGGLRVGSDRKLWSSINTLVWLAHSIWGPRHLGQAHSHVCLHVLVGEIVHSTLMNWHQ